MKKIGILILSLFLIPFSMQAQVLSLKQCIEYSSTNNSNLKVAHYEEEISQKKVNEQIGSVLPQIDFSSSITDNLLMATTMLPGELLGKPGTTIGVKMGTQYSWSAGLNLTQKIYDPTFGVALKATRVNNLYNQQNLQKVTEQTVYNISKCYYQTLVIQKQLDIIKTTLETSDKTLKSTVLKYQNGLAKKIDVDKLRVSFNNTKSQLQQTELSYKQSLNTLKYQMGMPVENEIILSDTLVDANTELAENELQNKLNPENRIDYQLQKTNILVEETTKESKQAAYLPTLSFFAKYGYQSMGQKSDFFTQSANWFPSASVGLNLTVPIFDGFQRKSRVAQATLNIEKAKENLRLTEQSIKVDVSNYEIQYRNSLDNIRNEKENLLLAQDIYKNTQLQYQQGMSNSLELVQAENSFREAQNNYFNKLLNLYIARLDLEKSKGTLLNTQK